MSNQFFTILETYFRCCTKRCSCCFNTKEKNDPADSSYNIYPYNMNGENSPFSFDDISNPNTPNTSSITLSSSSSSLDSLKPPYKRYQQFRPYMSIIPTNYYSD